MTIQNNQANLKIILTIVGLVLAVVILTTSKIVAQQSDTLMTRKIQVSFLYPLGSNGLHSNAYSNNFSFNYLYGVNGGVNGFELGGIGNYNKGKVKGVQIAGISNINVGSSKGVLLSGISNVAKDSISGVAVSGIVNYTAKSSKGLQLSTINISKEDVQGVQFGVINYAKRIKGIQFGLINIADSVESGASIGLINVVRKGGYFSFEATGGDALHGNLNFKIGIERFYTIFKAGYSSFSDKPVYSYGLGFGTIVPFSEKDKMSVDISTNVIGYDGELNGWGDDKKNILNKMDISYRRQLTSKFSLIAGPSLNYYVSEVKVGESVGTLRTMGNLYSSESDNKQKAVWIGFNAGLAFRL